MKNRAGDALELTLLCYARAGTTRVGAGGVTKELFEGEYFLAIALVDDAGLHDEAHFAHDGDVVEGIAGDSDEIGEFAGGDTA